MSDITVDEGKAEIIAEVAKCTADKTVQDFVAGKTLSCADAKCTYGENDGWTTLPDKSIFHEVDAIVAEKYDLCRELRPDIEKPYAKVNKGPQGQDICDSFYYHTDGVTKKLCTRNEILAVIAGQGVSDGNR